MPKHSRRCSLVSCLLAWAMLCVILAATPGRAQQGLADAMANDSAMAPRNSQQGPGDYTFKSGDFTMLVVPSMSLQWNDNINLTGTNQQSDVIVLPAVGFDLRYPLTKQNLLELNVTLGYSEYLSHSSLSSLYIQSGTGSGLSFDMVFDEIRINVHDRFSYVQDSAQDAGVANTGSFGTFQNSLGFTDIWNTKRVVYTLGYDHQDQLATSGTLDDTDHSSETAYVRAGYKWNSKLTTGIEGTAAFTAYSQNTLNDNVSYSIGAYGDWMPDAYFHAQPRMGFLIDEFSGSSQDLRTSDMTSWYADLDLTHQITRAISYSLSMGHSVNLGTQSDADETLYARLGMSWEFIKDNTFQTSFFYQNGNQGVGSTLLPGVSNPNLVSEKYDWYGGEFSISHRLSRRFILSLNYRITERTSSSANRGYAQNLVGIQLTYQLPQSQ